MGSAASACAMITTGDPAQTLFIGTELKASLSMKKGCEVFPSDPEKGE